MSDSFQFFAGPAHYFSQGDKVFIFTHEVVNFRIDSQKSYGNVIMSLGSRIKYGFSMALFPIIPWLLDEVNKSVAPGKALVSPQQRLRSVL